MCGISAILEPGARHPASTHTHDLLRMHAALSHRGPDGEGFLLVDTAMRGQVLPGPGSLVERQDGPLKLGVGFRRLSIQDRRAAANQPLARPGVQQWIVLNGEIYNFQELRRRLATEGYTFRTRSDTEVALAAYHKWGTACFEQFNGMWALLIIDLERGKLIGSRDRLGIKPLFYALDAERLLLASEPRAIAGVQRGGPTVHAASCMAFLRGAAPQVATLSSFDGIQAVPAATFFEVDLASSHVGIPRFQAYWNLAEHWAAPPVMPFDEAKAVFAALLQSAVEYQLAADVPVGSLLSGGLDSSMLTHLMAAAYGRQERTPRAFSVVYDDPQMDESRYIDAVLGAGGVDGQRVRLSPTHAWDLIDTVTAAYGEPLFGYHLLAYYRVLRLAREYGTTVILDGQGADELLGGYNFLEAAALREKLAHWQWRDFWAELHILAGQRRVPRRAILRADVLGHYKHCLVRKLGDGQEGQPYAWLDTRALAQPPWRDAAGSQPERGKDRSGLNQLLYQLTRYTNLPYLLVFLDRLSMAHSIEVRVPYLDHRLVEFCFRLPAAYKIAFGDRKRVLREVARAYLPRLITERTYKMGIVSHPQWLPLRSTYGEALRDMAHSPTLRQVPWLHAGAMTRFVEDYLAARHDDILAVWRLYAVWRWLEIFRPRFALDRAT